MKPILQTQATFPLPSLEQEDHKNLITKVMETYPITYTENSIIFSGDVNVVKELSKVINHYLSNIRSKKSGTKWRAKKLLHENKLLYFNDAQFNISFVNVLNKYKENIKNVLMNIDCYHDEYLKLLMSEFHDINRLYYATNKKPIRIARKLLKELSTPARSTLDKAIIDYIGK